MGWIKMVPRTTTLKLTLKIEASSLECDPFVIQRFFSEERRRWSRDFLFEVEATVKLTGSRSPTYPLDNPLEKTLLSCS